MIQVLGECKIHGPEKNVFFSVLTRLAGEHARLPSSMIIADNIEISTSNQSHTSGGFADIKQGQYKGLTVAVKTLRVGVVDDLDKIRRVSREEVFVAGRMTLRQPPSNSVKRLSFGIH